jgi:predicted small lipoprotein YifL
MLNARQTFSRWVLIGTLAGALGLAACGRKGGLELPPTGVDEANRDAAAVGAAIGSVPPIANQPVPIKRPKPLPIDSILN